MRYRLCGCVFVVTFLLISFLPAHITPAVQAQGGGGAFLSAPNIDRFPQVHTALKVYDGQGQFVHGLTSEQVSILENSITRPVLQLREQRLGVQIVVAVNPGPAMAIRNAKATSRYDLIKQALRTWASSRSASTIDDYSLLITNGPAASHTASAAQWLGALNSDTTDARSAAPDLDTLFRAVSLASDPAPRPGMGRMVLFITPPPTEPVEAQTLENLSAQANEQGIPISIWLVSSSGAFVTQTVQALMQLAASTGGQFFTFTGEEDLPSLETYLEPMRYIYEVQYVSGLNASGNYALVARVQAGDASVDSQPIEIELTLQPPVPAMVAPPTLIERHLPQKQDNSASTSTQMTSEAERSSGQSQLSPQETTIQVVYDFPDGRKRELVYSALLADGVPVDEHSEAPFDQFVWRLDGYTSDAAPKLQIQVRDTLGLSGTSVEIPVQISVEKAVVSPLARFQDSLPILGVLIALLAGAVLFLVLILGGQLRPRSQRVANSRRTRSDPVTQPVHIPSEPTQHHRSGWVNRLQWPQRQAGPKAEAFLYPQTDPSEARTVPPIPIPLEGLTIGSDAAQATLVLDDPTVEKLHANLSRQADGCYRLSDTGSVAGTWVNYTPISKEGTRLEHGDLIHIGRIGFRFTLRKPVQTRRPVVIANPVAQPLEEFPTDPESLEEESEL